MYILYKTTNLITHRIYIGVHKQEESEFDGYLGTNNHLWNAEEYYGIHNFVRKTLLITNNREYAYEKEREIVCQSFIDQVDRVYNIKLGGEGGFDYINDHNLNIYIMTESRAKACKENGKIMGETLKNEDQILASRENGKYACSQWNKLPRNQSQIEGLNFGRRLATRLPRTLVQKEQLDQARKIVNHNRWHAKRNIIKDWCPFCMEQK